MWSLSQMMIVLGMWKELLAENMLCMFKPATYNAYKWVSPKGEPNGKEKK